MNIGNQKKRSCLRKSGLGIIALLVAGGIVSLIIGACSSKSSVDSFEDSSEDPLEPFVERECFVFENLHDKNIIVGYNNTDHAGDCPKEVIIPETATTIKYGAFANKGLTSVEFSENLIEIQSEAFRDNELTEVNLPSSITAMGLGVFIYNSLTLASAITNNALLTVEDSWWKSTSESCFNLDSNNTLTAYYDTEGDIDTNPECPRIVVIPEGITTIGNSAVANNISGIITELHLPQSIETVENYAFDASLDLKELHIPDGVREVGEYAFHQYDNSQLALITIGSGIEEVNGSGFGGTSEEAVVYIKKPQKEVSLNYAFESGVIIIFTDGFKVEEGMF